MKPDAVPPPHAVSGLLRRYVAEWVRLAARRLPTMVEGESADPETSAPAARRLLYVDAFARSGLTGAGALSVTGPERAVEAVRALFEAAEREGGRRTPVEASAVLVEEDPAHVAALRRALAEDGWAGRVREGDAATSPGPGEVVLVEAPFAAVADGVRALASEPGTETLLWLAPPSPRALAWTGLRPWVEMEGASLLLLFPHADLHRQARHGALPVADLPPHARRIVEGCSAFLGDPRHGWLAAWRAAEREEGPAAAEARVAALYGELLRTAAGERLARPLRIGAQDGEGDVLHLFQVTGDPACALALNAAVRGAGLEDRAPAQAGRAAPLVPEPAGEPEVLELFAPEEMGGGRAARAARPREVDAAAVADGIASRFSGRSVPFREVLRSLADTDLSPDDARRAMALLKRGGRAVFRSLADDDAEVSFPQTPVLPPTAARRGRARPMDAPLFETLPEPDGEG